LHQNNLANNKEKIKEGITEAIKPMGMQDQLLNDIERLGLASGESLQGIIWTDMKSLNAITLESVESLNLIFDSESLGVVYGNMEQLSSIIWWNADQLNLGGW
jgi:hypothetical protein